MYWLRERAIAAKISMVCAPFVTYLFVEKNLFIMSLLVYSIVDTFIVITILSESEN